MHILVGINLAGWLLWQSNPKFMKRHFMVSYESVSNLRLHTILTAAFSHFDGWHLFSNMFALWFFGKDVGRILGGKRVSNQHHAFVLALQCKTAQGVSAQASSFL